MIREVFIPKTRIPIYSDDELNEYKELYTGKKDIYESVYTFNGFDKEDIIGENAIIDKIFLDFDYDSDLKFFDNVKKVIKFLNKLNLYYYIRFSGRGFHIFIKLKDIQLKNPKHAIRAWVKEMHQKTNTESDNAVIGDVRRVCRILGSMNMKTHHYCIPLDYTFLLSNTYHSICNKAKEINDDISDIHHKGVLLDLSEYDNKEEVIYQIDINTKNINVNTEHPPCIQKMMRDKELGYFERGQLIVYLRDDGYSLDEIIIILKNILSDSKYYHCTQEEGQPFYLYNREDMIFPSCKTLKDRGTCCSDVCDGPFLYL